MNYFVKAKLISLRRITLLIFTQNIIPDNIDFHLYIGDKRKETLKIIRHAANLNVNFYELEMSEGYPFGHRCFLYIPSYPLQVIDNSQAIHFAEAETLFSCPEISFGNFYAPENTTFRVWAPLSVSVILKIIRDDQHFDVYPMSRKEKGVYEISLPGDFDNINYCYLIENNGMTRQARDPYARATTLDSQYSAVVDLNKIKNIPYKYPKTKI